MAQTRFYNGKDYLLDEKKQVVILKPAFHNMLLDNKNNKGFKKFGGSSIGDIFETDAFKSKFKAFCHMARLKLPVLKKKYINAGVALEPKIFEIMQNHPNFKNVKIEHIEAKNVDYDYFKGQNDILGGVPDGLIPSKKIVLEMKTVQEKKQEVWEANNNSGVPEDYKKQAQLYAYLLKYKKYSIVAAFLKEEDYENPEKVDLTKRNIAQYSYIVNWNQAEDDANKIIKFWKEYSQLGISPVYNLDFDRDQVDYLRCHNLDEWHELFDKWKKEGKVDEDLEFDFK